MGVTQRIRAEWVIPASLEPLHRAEVVIEDGRISEIRRQDASLSVPSNLIDLGSSILLPGLVNVHTHLDYTLMRGLLEDIPFFPWIRELTARKSALDQDDWIASATIGAAEAVAGGVTTIGECTDSGAALIGARTLGLRGIVYQEVFGIDESVSVDQTILDLEQKLDALRLEAAGSLLTIGISPHAPYTVRPSLCRALAEYAGARNLPLCIHAAESQSESELIRHGGGSIAEMLHRRQIEWRAFGGSPVSYLNDVGLLGPRTLLVHGAQFSAGDRRIVQQSNSAWAHCPKSNAKLGNGIAPLRLMRSSYGDGPARIGLGSDSVASNNSMDLFEEMRFAVLAQRARARRYDAYTAAEAFELATIGGARALGLEREIGSIEPGKAADLTAIAVDPERVGPCYDPISALVYSAGARDVNFTMVGGETLFRNGTFEKTDLSESRVRFQLAAEKLRCWRPEV